VAVQAYDSVSINTILGPGSFIKGEMRVSGFLRIDGDLDGNLETPGKVIVGEKARIRGDIHALEVSVGGVVQGDIVAPNGVTLLSTALVLGTVITRRLQVEDSVLLTGRCFAVNDEERYQTVLADYYNRKAFITASSGAGDRERT